MRDDIGQYVVADSQYAIEFELRGIFLFLHIRYWRDYQLCRVLVKRTVRVVGQTAAELGLLSSLFAAMSTRANLLCSSRCSPVFVQLLDNCDLFPLALQIFKRFEDISLPKLMHKGSYNVLGQIDFFSVFKYLIVYLGGSLDLQCVLLASELAKVGIVITEVFCDVLPNAANPYLAGH